MRLRVLCSLLVIMSSLAGPGCGIAGSEVATSTMPQVRVPKERENQLLMDPKDVCKRSRRLRGKMAEMCKNGSALLERITYGVWMGTTECQWQFQNRRWNCTTVRKSLRKVLMRDTRETAFVNAIIAAGVTFAVTRACTSGDLVECSCEKTAKLSNKRGLQQRFGPRGGPLGTITGAATSSLDSSRTGVAPGEVPGEWEWGGCGDNVEFGYLRSRHFLDARHRKRSDIKTLMKLHNHEAGRLAVTNYMRTECKCHGLSGSCTLRTCWRKMPTFREVGNRLKERFDGAAKVIAHNDGRKFMPEGENIKPPGRVDLVYTENSPDFCRANRKTGSLGTTSRQCVFGSQGVDGCELLCCGRGFTSRDKNETVNCRCRFKWCCEVTCELCERTRRLYTCN